MPARSKVFDPRRVEATVHKSRGGEFWQQLVNGATLLVLGLILTIAVMVFIPVVERHRELIQRRDVVLSQIESQRLLQLELQTQLNMIQGDRVYIERVARDVLNYGRQGETVFRFPDYGKQQQPDLSGSPSQ
ncbi:MAG: septum formation initiator family protein [Candidatus Methylacidiphilales bacterium]